MLLHQPPRRDYQQGEPEDGNEDDEKGGVCAMIHPILVDDDNDDDDDAHQPGVLSVWSLPVGFSSLRRAVSLARILYICRLWSSSYCSLLCLRL